MSVDLGIPFKVGDVLRVIDFTDDIQAPHARVFNPLRRELIGKLVTVRGFHRPEFSDIWEVLLEEGPLQYSWSAKWFVREPLGLKHLVRRYHEE